ncbi:ABC transporter permease [Ruminococcus sp. Marseille-P6503]|uniref:ABC transporter permease n=1 Tax=Ruminococcus sp. Marseille-P6503 TaxID=2364796 RepID=UPI001FA9A229|nr:ABC transporter permease [Ruminococcus sp. Marseille-P6503]
MGAIFRREALSYFTSPIGYIFLAAFYACSAVSFASVSLNYGTTQLDGVFGELMIILIVLIPILTMRTLSEEKKNKTDQCLLTAPVSLWGIVLGKFLAAFLIYILGVAITIVYAVVVSAYAAPDWTVILGNVTGLALLGAAFIAVGMFCSSFTENQVVSAVISFIVMVALYLFTTIGDVIPIDFVENIMPDFSNAARAVIVALVIAAAGAVIYFIAGRKANTIIITAAAALILGLFTYAGDRLPDVFSKLSFWERYYGFTYGLFDLSNVLFFISAAAVFLFLSVRVLEKRRWS